MPTVSAGNELVVMVNAAAIVTDSALAAVAPTASVTRTVKLNVPAVVGVPLMTPPLVMGLSPPGSVPADNDQVGVPVPPVAAIV